MVSGRVRGWERTKALHAHVSSRSSRSSRRRVTHAPREGQAHMARGGGVCVRHVVVVWSKAWHCQHSKKEGRRPASFLPPPCLLSTWSKSDDEHTWARVGWWGWLIGHWPFVRSIACRGGGWGENKKGGVVQANQARAKRRRSHECLLATRQEESNVALLMERSRLRGPAGGLLAKVGASSLT